MKKLTAILTATLLICAGTAFGEPITKLKANSDIRIAILAHFSHVPAWVPVQKGIDDAAKSLGITVEVSGPSDFSVAKQVNMFQGKIAAGVDAIATTMPDSQAFNNVTQEALKRGIPVMSVNADAPDSGRLAYVGQSNFMAGYKVGKHLTELIKGGKVMIGIHSLGAKNLQDRIDGIEKALKEGGNFESKVVEVTTNLVRAQTLVESWYQANKDAVAMLGVEEVSGIAIKKTIERNKLGDKVIGASFDLVKDVVQGIKDGTMTYTVDQQLYMQGYMTVQLLYLKVRYDISPADIDTGATIIDKSNIESAMFLAENSYR